MRVGQSITFSVYVCFSLRRLKWIQLFHDTSLWLWMFWGCTFIASTSLLCRIRASFDWISLNVNCMGARSLAARSEMRFWLKSRCLFPLRSYPCSVFLVQGDRMSLWKIAWNVAQHVFCRNLYIVFTAKKSRPKNLGYICIFLNLAKVNSRPSGENSPNLVTLFLLGFVVSHRGANTTVVIYNSESWIFSFYRFPPDGQAHLQTAA
jgi:hypothetical protein